MNLKIRKISAFLFALLMIFNTTISFAANFRVKDILENQYQTPIPNMDMKTLNWYEATFAIYKKSVGYPDNSAYLEEFNSSKDHDNKEKIKTTREIMRSTLKLQWGVKDRATGLDVLESLSKNGIKNKSAWDLSRAMSNIFIYYKASYIDFDTAMELSYSVANDIKKVFNSWDAFNDSYLEGYKKWSGRNDRKTIYDSIKSSNDNVFKKNLWNTSLVKYSGGGKDDNKGNGKSDDANNLLTVENLQRAAHDGDGDAYCYLGLMYEKGLGVEINLQLAKDYYEKGIELGSSDAMCNVGLMYCLGTYTNVPNITQGKEYLEKAAKMGNERAERMLKILQSGIFSSLENDNK